MLESRRKRVVVKREGEAAACAVCGEPAERWTATWTDRKAKGKCLSFCRAVSGCSPLYHGHGPSHHTPSSCRTKDLPDDSRLPLLPLIILPLLPMLASLEVLSVPVSVRSIAISLRLLAA